MRTLLILLTTIALLVPLYLGGCAVLGVAQWLMPTQPAYPYQVTGDGFVASLSLVGLLISAGLLFANIALLRSVLGRRPLKSKIAVLILAFVDIGATFLSVGLVAESWLLAAVVFAACAAKGVLTLRWVASAPAAGSSGPPASR